MEHEHRREPRHTYRHRLSITLNRHFARGEVLDWSIHGLQVLSTIPIEGVNKEGRLRFHVEKSQGLQGAPKLWTREGSLKWVRESKEEGGWLLGIQLDEPLEDLPLADVEKYITEEDFCYLFFLLETEDPSSSAFNQ